MLSIFIFVCSLRVAHAVTDSRSDDGLTEFPTDVTADVTKLMLTKNAITRVPPEALEGLPVLSYLGIADNDLTAFPNLTAVADSLENLYAYKNTIAFVDGALVEVLYKLKKLSLQDNDLVSFPTLTSGACKSLIYLNLANNPLATTPSFQHYTVLSELWLQVTDISQPPVIGGEAVSQLTTLRLERTDVGEIPVALMSGMTSLETLKLTDSAVSLLPSPCVGDIGALEVRATSTAVSVCACRHVWLKVAADRGADIRVDDADCSGYLWSTSTVKQLVEACSSTDAGISTVYAKRMFHGFFCTFPLHSVVHGITLNACLSVCDRTPACFSFNFLDHGGTGDCVILAPAGNLDLQVTNMTSLQWSYYVT